MNRLIRPNLTPIVLVLLAVLPSVMGMSSGMVRCEHPGAESHVATNDHHAVTEAGEVDPCCDHDTPADPDRPADDQPCNDSPLEIEFAPSQHAGPTLDLPDAPLLPVTAWLPAEPASPFVCHLDEWTRGQPPGPEPCVLLKTARFLI